MNVDIDPGDQNIILYIWDIIKREVCLNDLRHPSPEPEQWGKEKSPDQQVLRALRVCLHCGQRPVEQLWLVQVN